MSLVDTGKGYIRMEIDGKPFRDVQCNCYDPDQRVVECEESGVHTQVVGGVWWFVVCGLGLCLGVAGNAILATLSRGVDFLRTCQALRRRESNVSKVSACS